MTAWHSDESLAGGTEASWVNLHNRNFQACVGEGCNGILTDERGVPIDTSQWSPGPVSDHPQTCFAMDSGGLVDDFSCPDLRSGVCQADCSDALGCDVNSAPADGHATNVVNDTLST